MAKLNPRTQAILPEAFNNLVGTFDLWVKEMTPEMIINEIYTPKRVAGILKWHGLDPAHPEVQDVINSAWALAFDPETNKRALLTFEECKQEGLSSKDAMVHVAAVYHPDLLYGHVDPGDGIIEVEQAETPVPELQFSIARGISLIASCVSLQEFI